MKKIVTLLLAFVLLVCCVSCGTPDKKDSGSSESAMTLPGNVPVSSVIYAEFCNPDDSSPDKISWAEGKMNGIRKEEYTDRAVLEALCKCFEGWNPTENAAPPIDGFTSNYLLVGDGLYIGFYTEHSTIDGKTEEALRGHWKGQQVYFPAAFEDWLQARGLIEK